jgi:archaeal flagellin N-terminal-like domain
VFETDRRGLSPVVGVVVLVVITLMMGVSVAWSVGTCETTLPEDRTDSVVDDGTTNQRVQPVEDEVIYALDDDAGETTTHVVVLDVTGDNVGNSLNEIEISYAASDASGTGADQIRLAGFDTTTTVGSRPTGATTSRRTTSTRRTAA